MRHAATLVALACATAVGAQELLPLVQPKGETPASVSEASSVSSSPILLIDLPIEPIRAASGDDLLSAARRNDFRAFEALYAESHPSGALADLHELWTWSEADRTGAFYGAEMHARFARAYPGFADYIAAYRIVDRNGNVFYPTAETRAFLIRQASGGKAPIVRVAASEPRHPERNAGELVAGPTPSTRLRMTPMTSSATPGKRHRRIIKASLPTAKPVVQVASVPVATAPHPALRATLSPQSGARGNGNQVVQAQVVDAPTSSRGIFLIILGLVGIGVLTTMLRAPQAEEEVPVETTPFTGQSEVPDEHRATGSHG